MKVLWNKGEFYTQVYEKPFCTQEPRGFSHREVQFSGTMNEKKKAYVQFVKEDVVPNCVKEE
jgi:hypothetical protein